LDTGKIVPRSSARKFALSCQENIGRRKAAFGGSEARWREEVMPPSVGRKAGQERPRSQCRRRTCRDARLAKTTPGRNAAYGRKFGSLARGSDAAPQEVMPGETSGEVMLLRRRQKRASLLTQASRTSCGQSRLRRGQSLQAVARKTIRTPNRFGEASSDFVGLRAVLR